MNHKADPLNREYPIVRSHTVEVITKSGQARYNIPDADFLRDKIILGVIVRQQATGNPRKSKNGYSLISNDALDCCFILLAADSQNVYNDHPLAHFVHERAASAPGDYAQLYLDKGFDPTASSIRFTNTAVVEDEKAVELTFMYALPKDVCNV
jgi:hypothetical protein